MNTTWGRVAVALSIGALTLSGCSDDPEPSATPTPTASATSSVSASPSSSASASPTASPSTSASAATVPAAARARTEAGAIAFLNFYFAEFNRALRDPKNAPDLFAYADKDCISCRKSQDLVDEYAKGGWSVKQSGMRVLEPTLATGATAEKVIINFTLKEASQPLFQNGKQTSNKVPANSAKRAVALRWVNDGWQVFDLEAI